MSGHFSNQAFPRSALIGAAALLGISLLAAAGSRFTDIGSPRLPAAMPALSLELRFEDRADGSVAVFIDESDDAILAAEPGGSGFIRGVLRGLGRERKLRAIAATEPYRLTSWNDGRLTLSDPATGIDIDLEPFGVTNKEAFARLLRTDAAEAARISQVSRQQQ